MDWALTRPLAVLTRRGTVACSIFGSRLKANAEPERRAGCRELG